jgi:hypothetical protein
MTSERPPSSDEARGLLRPLDERWITELERAMGLKRLTPLWAKAEIVLGLSAAAFGLKLLSGEGMTAWAGGALTVPGIYLALAGHRSHLYLSMNRHIAYLLQTIAESARGEQE